MPWYSYNPIDSYPHNPLNPNNYTLIGIVPPLCPDPNDFLCAIQSAGGAKPTISSGLCQQMVIALANKIETSNILLRPTLY
ncbi:hypothetical protein [Sphingobacterium faecium]|uniref:hypothetical protein n=1 Tax=Sphingobacterium faecium TaxID=34087 RepID=UPI003209675D